MVNWQKEAIDDLRRYPALRQSLDSIRERRAALDLQAGAVRSSFRDAAPVSGGGGSGAEDKLIACIMERERLAANYKAVSKLVRQIEIALSLLGEDEQLALERFYIHHQDRHVERLCEELGYEKSNVYELKDRALRRFTIAMYGILDL